jgi:hypothetical protein
VLHAYDRSASVYKDLVIVGQNVSLQAAGVTRLTVQSDGMIRLGPSSQIIFGTGATIYGYGADGAGTQLIGMQGLTVTPGTLYAAALQVNGGAVVANNLNVNGALGVAGNQTIGASLSIGLDLTVARNVGVTGGLSAAQLNSTGPISAAGDITTNASIGAYGGNVFFESSRQVMIRWQPSQGRLEVPYGNGLWAAHVTAEGNMSAAAAGFTKFGANGANGQFQVMPGNATVTCLYSPSIVSAFAVNELNHHGKILWINGGAGGTSGWEQTSARRYKDNIVPFPEAEALALVKNPALGGYRYTSNLANDRPDVGFIAEDWTEALPEVIQSADGQVESMNYTSITPILLVALRALLGRVEALEAKEAA